MFCITEDLASLDKLINRGAATTANVTTFNQCGFVLTANIVDVSTSSTVVSVARLKWTFVSEGTKVWTEIAA